MQDPVRTLREGGLVMMVDHVATGRGAELWLAAEVAEAAQVARLVRYTSGFLTVALSAARASALGLPPMVNSVARLHDTRPVPAVTCDAADGVSTGISAADRALTARRLSDPASGPDDFKRPGHLVPVRVRERVTDPTCAASAALFLCAISAVQPAMLRCELVLDSGELADASAAIELARHLRLPTVALQDLVVPAMEWIA